MLMKSDFSNKIFLLFLFICSFTNAQQKGEVFKTFPSYPQENINIGYITVTKSMYDLTFHDDTINEKYKNLVKTFFNQRYHGYSKLKTYRLEIAKCFDGWYIENKKLMH